MRDFDGTGKCSFSPPQYAKIGLGVGAAADMLGMPRAPIGTTVPANATSCPTHQVTAGLCLNAAGTQNGKILRLRGEGMRGRNDAVQ